MEINKLVRPSILQLTPYSSARDEFKETESNMIFVDANENPFNTLVNRYPDPQQQEVKTILANTKGIETDNILLGNGSDEVLDLIFRAFCEPNKESVITLPPTYGMYDVLANINAIEVKKVLLKENFQPNVAAILKAVTPNTKILFLCSPNNPTGNSFLDTEVEKLLNEFNGLVVIDEAYIDFASENSWLLRLQEFPSLIITQTLSKAYGMAGIRLGVCYASAQIISILNKIKPPYNVNQLTQEAAKKRLLASEEVEKEVTNIIIQRQWLITQLKEVSFVSEIYPTDANFILIKVDDATKRYNQLLQKEIVVRNRTNQPLCENCLRITVGTEQENKQLINVLKTL
jgi:histidinol-phosphate aminotransferase